MQEKVLLIDNCEVSRLGFDAIFKKQDFYTEYLTVNQSNYLKSLKKNNPSVLIVNSICIPIKNINNIVERFYEFKNSDDAKIILISNKFYPNISNKIDGHINLRTCSKDLLLCMEYFKNNKKFISAEFKDTLKTQVSDFNFEKTDLYKDFKNLTTKETSVLKLIVEGKSSIEISDTLFNSVRTIDAHRRKICDKFGLRGQGKLSLFVMENKEFLNRIFKNNNILSL